MNRRTSNRHAPTRDGAAAEPRRRRASLLDAASALASLGVVAAAAAAGAPGDRGGPPSAAPDGGGPPSAVPAPPRAGGGTITGPDDDDRRRRDYYVRNEDEDQGLSMSATTGLTVPVSSVRGDVPMTFPEKLMDVLSNPETSDVISWLPHGKGFAILHKRRFASEVMPLYFKQGKFTSFTRKLNRWGFARVQAGPEAGAYYHRYFQRGNHLLCMQMHCQAINASSSKKSSSKGGKGNSSSQRKSSSTRSSGLSSPGPSPPPQDGARAPAEDPAEEGPESMASFDAVLGLQRRLLVEARAEEMLRGNQSSATGPTAGFDKVFDRQQELLRSSGGGGRPDGPPSSPARRPPCELPSRFATRPRPGDRLVGIDRPLDAEARRPSDPRDYFARQRPASFGELAATVADSGAASMAHPRGYLPLQHSIGRFDEISRRSSDPRDYLLHRQRADDARFDGAEVISPLGQRLILGESSRRMHHRLVIDSALRALESSRADIAMPPSALRPDAYSSSTTRSLAEIHSAMQERLRRLREYNRSVEDALKGGDDCEEGRGADFSQLDVARLRREIGRGGVDAPGGSATGAYASRPGPSHGGQGPSPRGGRASAA